MDLLKALERGLVHLNMTDFYFISRMSLVKDERLFDRFDRAFSEYFADLDRVDGVMAEELPLEQLREVLLSRDCLATDERRNEFDQLIQDYQELLTRSDRQLHQGEASQEEPGASGQSDEGEAGEGTVDQNGGGKNDENGECGESRESGETGESGESGENGESGDEGNEGEEGSGEDGLSGEGESRTGVYGVKDHQEESFNRKAVKIWQQRLFADYDEDVELGTRNIKMALRRLRKFARTGAQDELDLAGTIRSTARNGGLLDIQMVPERHNSIKVLLFLDVGGSMDDHILLCEQLFSAAHTEFKYLQSFYFHNFVYESVWTDNTRRNEERVSVMDVIHKFGSDYKVIFVGDAHMARHEIAEKGGSVEHYNAESGQQWFARLTDNFRHVVWINPVDESKWQDSYTTVMVQRLVENRMHHLSVTGLESAMKYLTR
jgi:uncharacterized protein with von Willebrand factor type A (vWA) domain